MPIRITDTGEFAGYASVFHVRDDAGDIVLPGAFKRTLSRHGPAAVRMLWQHDVRRPIGVWREIREDERGLFVRGQLALSSAAGREAAELVKIGAVDGLSIGFKTIRASRDRRTGIRKLTKVDLWEISLVTFPMLASARVTALKTLGPLAASLPGDTDAGRQHRPDCLHNARPSSDTAARLQNGAVTVRRGTSRPGALS